MNKEFFFNYMCCKDFDLPLNAPVSEPNGKASKPKKKKRRTKKEPKKKKKKPKYIAPKLPYVADELGVFRYVSLFTEPDNIPKY